MDIKFKGEYNVQEAADSLAGILTLFQEHYGIDNFKDIKLEMNLLNDQGEEVELVDTVTSEVLGVFDVHKPQPKNEPKPSLKLVVDNTGK